MHENILISVIVPAYNVENTLEKCLESISKQTFKDYEVILVDDGSIDGTSELVDILSEKYHFVKSFHKENGGLGSARNYGIGKSKGKYICFVDSDDYIYPEYLETLYRGVFDLKTDICICGYIYDDNKNETHISPKSKMTTGVELIKEFAYGNSFLYFAWNKLYKMSIINKMTMLFENRHCAEDMYFNCIYYQYVERACILSDCLYSYSVNLSSLSNGRRDNFIRDMSLVDRKFKNLCIEKEIHSSVCDNFKLVLMRNCFSNYFNSKIENYNEYKKYFDNCIDCFAILSLNPSVKDITKLDRIVYFFAKHKWYFSLYICTYISKFSKRNSLRLFNLLRCSVSGNQKRQYKKE